LLDIDHCGSPVFDGGVGMALASWDKINDNKKDREEIFHGC
jgi:hypothetical protein